jgi:hypothetical protein
VGTDLDALFGVPRFNLSFWRSERFHILAFRLARQLILCQPLSNDLANDDFETVGIVHRAVIVAEDLLIEITEWVNVGAT